MRLFLRLTVDLRPMSCDKARKLLVERCQTEFEKGCWSDLDPSELEKVKFVTETTAKREDIQREFQKKVARTRRQWLQNIKFIGELYKEKILSARLIHRCLAKLLDESDGRFCDESLEGLCCLLSEIDDRQKNTDTSTTSAARSVFRHLTYAGYAETTGMNTTIFS